MRNSKIAVRTFTRLKGLAGALLGAAVSACGSPDSSICGKAFRANQASLLPNASACPGCSEENLRRSIDGDGNSAGRLTFNSDGASAAGGEYYLGVVQGPRFSGSGRPGAYVTFPADSFSNVGISFRTYLDGEQQEQIACSSDAGGCSASFEPIAGAGGYTYYGGPSSLPFDQLDVRVTINGAAAGSSVLVHEVCASR